MLTLKLASGLADRPTSGTMTISTFSPMALSSAAIFKVHAAPVGTPWMWTLAFGQNEDRTPTHGYAETREAAMTAFAGSWRWE
jgi:hypothetical protein